jgi:hypothetical protein
VDDKLVQLARNQLVQLAKQQQNNHICSIRNRNYSIYMKSIKEGKGTTAANDGKEMTRRTKTNDQTTAKVQRCGNILGEW